jgi:tRNA A-37 threonylcarbamoyl transferase component Bud32
MAVRRMLVAGRYRLHEPVGAGGMGRVWLARDEMLDRDVAVKEFVPPEWMTDAERDRLRVRTLREARSAARLNHPHVVRIYDVVHADDLPWIVMEYVPSRSLYQVIVQDGPLPPLAVARIGLDVLDALTAAHDAGVLHRDVKPHNVLIGHDGRVVLTDFGLATFVDDGMVTGPGLIVGSPQYVSPERAREGASTVESDLWSLGATLYCAVEGRSPYARESAMATLMALATEEPDPPALAGPLLPVLDGLLQHDPAARLTAEQVESQLRQVMAGGAAPSARLRSPRRAAQHHFAQDGPVSGSPRWQAAGHAAVPSPRRAADEDIQGLRGPVPEGPGSEGPRSEGPGPDGPVPDGPGPDGPGAGVPVPAGGVVGAARSAAVPDAAGFVADGAAAASPSHGPVPGRGQQGQLSAGQDEQPVGTDRRVIHPALLRRPVAGDADLVDAAGNGRPEPGAGAPDRADQVGPGVVGSGVVVPEQVHSGRAASDRGVHGSGQAGPDSAGVSSAGRMGPRGPWHRQPSGSAPGNARVGSPRRSRYRLAVAGVVLVASLGGGGVGVGWLVQRADRGLQALPAASGSAPTVAVGTGGTAAGAGGFGPSTCDRPSDKDLRRTPLPGAYRTPPGDGLALLPGWSYHRDETGFVVAVPDGWTYQRVGTTVCFGEPAGTRVLSIDTARKPSADPVLACRREAQRLREAGALPGYAEVGIARVPYQARAADWEYRYRDDAGDQMHAATRWFTSGGKAYALGWVTREFDWQVNRSILVMIRTSFGSAAA